MNTYLCKLLPPRKTFIADMTADEMAVMQAHSAYWAPRLADGTAVAMGPVVEAAGAGWGLGIFRAADEASLRALTGNDPAILSGKGFSYEICVMPRGVTLGKAPA